MSEDSLRGLANVFEEVAPGLLLNLYEECYGFFKNGRFVIVDDEAARAKVDAHRALHGVLELQGN